LDKCKHNYSPFGGMVLRGRAPFAEGGGRNQKGKGQD
jgi:hypothetical protein